MEKNSEFNLLKIKFERKLSRLCEQPTPDWPKWASHHCNQCKQYSVPDANVEGGEDHFSPVISFSNPVGSFITSALMSGALNAATRTSVKTNIFCPYCKGSNLIDKPYEALNQLTPKEKKLLSYLQKKEERECDEEKISTKKKEINSQIGCLVFCTFIFLIPFILGLGIRSTTPFKDMGKYYCVGSLFMISVTWVFYYFIPKSKASESEEILRISKKKTNRQKANKEKKLVELFVK